MIALRSPMHALLWKEWRTLRNLRWAGMILGILLPVCFIAGAELSREGWAPLGSGGIYSVTDILREAVPTAFAYGLWPLVALLLITQSLGGDRASGTEAFLLERPVSRGRIWAVRILVSLASIAAVVAVTGGIWAAWYGLGGDGSPEGSMKPIALFRVGGELILLATICGALASAIVSPPILAVLAAAVFAALPLVLGATLNGLFPYALFGGGKVTDVLVSMLGWVGVSIYLIASFVATCMGEPAGRGRRARGAGILGLGVVATLFIFAISAQAAQRWNAAHPDVDGDLIPSPGGDRLLLSDPFGGQVWLVDSSDGRVRQHFPMPCYGAFWRKAGGMFALSTSAGPLGSEVRPRISFFDQDGRVSGSSWHADTRDEGVLRVAWDGDIAVFKVLSPTRSRLVFFDPGKGERAVIPVTGEIRSWEYAGTLWDGSPAIWKLAPGEVPTVDVPVPPGEDIKRKSYGLYRVSLSAHAVEPVPLVEESGFPYRSRALSPSGRWWRRDRARTEPQEMIDLETGRAVPATRGGWPDDPLRFYVDTTDSASTLMQARGAEEGRGLRTWTDADVDLKRSPGDRYLLVRVVTKPSIQPPRHGKMALWLYDIEHEAWKPLYAPRGLKSSPQMLPGDIPMTWVGPSLISWSGPGVLVLQNVEAPDDVRFVAHER